jgi:hypothetical protein
LTQFANNIFEKLTEGETAETATASSVGATLSLDQERRPKTLQDLENADVLSGQLVAISQNLFFLHRQQRGQIS